MVDFVAVIEKAVNGLADNTPEMREKVYEKARAAIVRQLDNIDPPVSDAVKDKQLAKLEEAIAEVEDRNTEAIIDDDAFTDMFADDDAAAMESEAAVPEADPEPRPQRAAAGPAEPTAPPTAPESGPADYGYGQGGYDQFGLDNTTSPPPNARDGGYSQDYLADHPAGEFFEPNRSGVVRTATIAVAMLLLVVAAGFAVWFWGGGIISMVYTPSPQIEESAPAVGVDDSSTNGAPAATEPEVETAAVPSSVTDTPDSGTSEQQKFTQRLLEDGSEVDAGLPAGSARPTAEEGKSVASIDTAAGDLRATEPETGAATTAVSPPAIGQKMFIYEERLGQQAPTAQEGRVVWSIVRESPGEDLPPEPAIQAEIEAPERGLSAVMTIKRNADPSLPASHLIEIVFALTEVFEGNGIGSIQNFAMKDTEEATGDSLIAVPAKITDSFFMIALNDYVEAVDLNMRLLREGNWIDLPVAYGNGRRALLTLEKGSTGAEVFDQVIRAWDARATDTSQSQ